MNWEVGYEKYRTNYVSINIRSFVILSLHYPVLFFCYFVFVIPCLPFHLLLCLYNTLSSVSSVTLSL